MLLGNWSQTFSNEYAQEEDQWIEKAKLYRIMLVVLLFKLSCSRTNRQKVRLERPLDDVYFFY